MSFFFYFNTLKKVNTMHYILWIQPSSILGLFPVASH